MSVKISYTDFGVDINFEKITKVMLLRETRTNISIAEWLDESDASQAAAISEISMLATKFSEHVIQTENELKLSHKCLANLSSNSLNALGLPPNPDFTISIKMKGVLRNPDFDLEYKWNTQSSQLLGARLQTLSQDYIVPDPIFSIIETIENYRREAEKPVDKQWHLMATIKNLLETNSSVNPDFSEASRADIADLQGSLAEINIKSANSFSLRVERQSDGITFNPVLFQKKPEKIVGQDNEDYEDTSILSENDSLLNDNQTLRFEHGNQSFDHFLKVKKTYIVGKNEYLLIEDDLYEALELVKQKKNSNPESREDFARNPKRALTEYLENKNRASSETSTDNIRLEETLNQQQELETRIGELFQETREFSERVIKLGLWIPPALPYVKYVDNGWVPETFGVKIGDKYVPIKPEEVETLIEKVTKAIEKGETSIEFNSTKIEANENTLEVLNQLDGLKKAQTTGSESTSKSVEKQTHVLIVKENFEDLDYVQNYVPRGASTKKKAPESITSKLKAHQEKSLEWMIDTYLNGLPGILNADDQGLGKTLQSISFLAWLQQYKKDKTGKPLAPILIVAPTSLLRNWQEEVDTHMNDDQLGIKIEAYGSRLKEYRSGLSGLDLDDANEISRLDFSSLSDEDRTYPTWVLTTYTTLTNYQQSFGQVPFSAVVFDEIQNIKNPGTLQNNAAKSLKADFKIGLTGTPVENSLSDLWAILDTLVPGYLGTLKNFTDKFNSPDENMLKELYRRIFEEGKNKSSKKALPPIGIRRMKSEAASDLPLKRYEKYPIEMDGIQDQAYTQLIDDLNYAKQNGIRTSSFKQIDGLRSVSLHPEKLELAASEDNDLEDFLFRSARIKKATEILSDIQASGGKALVFLERVELQYLLQTFFKKKFKLEKVDIINGNVSVPRRAQIVREFQANIDNKSFDLLILGPKSAGVGLTLTAATHVIHLARWWNPAVEEQCNDRIYRIGQQKDVTIHIPLAIHSQFKEKSFDCILNNIMIKKRRLFQGVLMPAKSNEEESSGILEFINSNEDKIDLSEIDRMTGQQFEDWIGNQAKKGPWRSANTSISRDGGADKILTHTERTSEHVIIQAKVTNSPDQNLSEGAIKEVLNARKNYPDLKNSHCVVVTNYRGFTNSAEELAKKENVKLVSREDLCLWPNHII